MDKVIPFSVGNGEGDDPTLGALQALSDQLAELGNDVTAMNEKPLPRAANGKLRDLMLGLITAALFALFAFLWNAHADIEVIKDFIARTHPVGGG